MQRIADAMRIMFAANMTLYPEGQGIPINLDRL
jgi:hypothetical protein